MANTISLNGVLYGVGQPRKAPTDIERTVDAFGTEERAANGEFWQAGAVVKRKWTLTWNNVDPTTRAAVAALAELLTSFVFVDQDGTAYTVLCPLSGRYREGIGIQGADNTKLYYGVTLTFEQV